MKVAARQLVERSVVVMRSKTCAKLSTEGSISLLIDGGFSGGLCYAYVRRSVCVGS